jgi:hypothetical protein
VLGPDKVTFTGTFTQFLDMYGSPEPLQQPHPPFWCGGASVAALRRAARFAETWQPTPMALEDLAERKAALIEASAAIGRPAAPNTRIDFSRATPSQVVAELSRYREAAALEAFQINFHGNRDLGQLLDAMARFICEVKPRLG